MSNLKGTSRAERIARYKEDRRKQLDSQFASLSQPQDVSKRYEPRTTRASRLRAAACAQEFSSLSNSKAENEKPSQVSTSVPARRSSNGLEQDKSNKRKSYLNRAVKSEEILQNDKTSERRYSRRIFKTELVNQNSKKSTVDNNSVQNESSPTLHKPNTHSANSNMRTFSKKTDHGVPTENKQKNYGSTISKQEKKSDKAEEEKLTRNISVPKSANSISGRSIKEVRSKENINCIKKNAVNGDSSNLKVLENDRPRKSSSMSRKMEELTELTHDVLARVERLTNKSNNLIKIETDNSLKDDVIGATTAVPTSSFDNLFGRDNVNVRHNNKADVGVSLNCDIRKTHSILKKKSIEETFVSQSTVVTLNHPLVSGPVSILKRKISQDDFNSQSGSTWTNTNTNTSPVTFSPNVVDPSTSRKRQGILKKRRSLDESQVLRNRSCSPDVSQSSRSILKKQRRSSLEDIIRTQSPESGLHGILKRRASKHEEDLDSMNNSPEPHSILKRRSGTSSAGSNTNSPHVSIATAVILAAAEGAEIILDDNESVKPILKKRSSSDEQPYAENIGNEVPKPILKKKSSVDWDDCEDKPKRPILKKSSLEDKSFEDSEYTYRGNSLKYNHQSTDDELTQSKNYQETSSRDHSPRPRLSFLMDEETHRRNSRRSHTVCTDHDVDSNSKDLDNQNRRPVSVLDMILNFENTLNTGAIPKTCKSKRHSERYSTQPVTSQELQVSLDLVENRLQLDQSSNSNPRTTLESIENCSINTHSLTDLTTSANISDSCFSHLNTTHDSGVSIKMSSDSAFQSLGDGLELDKEEKSPLETSLDSNSLKSGKCLMKALAEEAKNIRMRKGNAVANLKMKQTDVIPRPSSSRFSTQPVTSDEVKEASNLKNVEAEGDVKLDRSDPCRLSLSERIKLFSSVSEEKRCKLPKPRFSRYQTQPVTSEEVKTARVFPARVQYSIALGNSKTSDSVVVESKRILKSKAESAEVETTPAPNSKSVLKQSETVKSTQDYNTSSKTDNSDTTQDEGISSEEQYSGSDIEGDGEEKWKSLNSDSTRAESYKKSVTIRDKTFLKKSNENSTKMFDKNSDTASDKEFIPVIELKDNRRRLRGKSSNENLIVKSKSYNTINRDEDKNKNSEVRRSLTTTKMPKSIAELQAKLKKSGDNEWKKRIPKLNSANEELVLINVKNIYNETLSEKSSILDARKDELDAAAKQWRSRVEQSDALNFSVAGRMQQTTEVPKINIINADKSKRTPKAKAFKGKEGGDNEQSESTPVSPENKGVSDFKRSISLPGSGDGNAPKDLEKSANATSRKVKIDRPDNVTFTNFYKSINLEKKVNNLCVTIDDFDSIVSHTDNLLVQKRSIKVQKRREPSKNPVKALAARTDIIDEYTEVITGVAEREKQRLNVEKLAKSSNFAVEALAGLASKENFSSVALKRSSSLNSTFPPFKDLMLLQIKGRRFVQTRLVEPVASSINEGDNFILITPTSVYHYIGSYSNVIEQSRASDIVNSIHRTSDLGCRADKIISINSKRIGSCREEDINNFWKLMGSNKTEQVTSAGHPDEDEIYESSILSTNMIYEYKNDELLPVDKYWGAIPKIEMLSALKIFVFDFGSEMYFWTGKNASLEEKKKGLKLARELWNEGYNYSECGVNPIEISHALGSRQTHTVNLKDKIRPKWTLFAKITQHGETVLFKEKFLDWPDYSRVIRVKTEDSDKNIDVKFDFKPCDINKLLQRDLLQPDLVVDGLHLGRGKDYFDEETNRLFNFTTKKITCWVIHEYSHEEINTKSIGQFYNGNSYIIRWEYCGIVTGRELSGKPSKHVQAGRDYCVYFCWQGQKATVNEKGAAALLTITLDSENARQIRVAQGAEPPAFLSLFKGSMVVHDGKMEKPIDANCKLYICNNEVESETFLTQVPCSMRSLRSRSSFLFVNPKQNNIIIWNGSKASEESKNNAKEVTNKIIKSRPDEFGFMDDLNITTETVLEGSENSSFLNILGDKRQLYLSLSKNVHSYDYTPRLFHLTSLSGSFECVEILCPYRNEYVTSYPFIQSDLYSVNQPALFMVDDGTAMWLWQGWWPEREDDLNLVDQTGSGRIRWQEERKAAMQTVVNYCKAKFDNKEPLLAYLVWAGLEPLAFTNLFPTWEERDDIAELNIQDGKKSGEAIEVEKELALLTRSTYPLEQLMQRPLPDGVDPVHLENYLSPEDFEKLTSMPLEEFRKLPMWKQTAIKKEKDLF